MTELATFGAGCFWGVEKAFKKKFPEILTQVGYTGGSKENPTYEQVCTGKTGHAEAIQIQFDPKKYTYETMVDFLYLTDLCINHKLPNARSNDYE
jgi:peptide-methionine (S)-S-oxide reductase